MMLISRHIRTFVCHHNKYRLCNAYKLTLNKQFYWRARVSPIGNTKRTLLFTQRLHPILPVQDCGQASDTSEMTWRTENRKTVNVRSSLMHMVTVHIERMKDIELFATKCSFTQATIWKQVDPSKGRNTLIDVFWLFQRLTKHDPRIIAKIEVKTISKIAIWSQVQNLHQYE